jgi:hypothetical protein
MCRLSVWLGLKCNSCVFRRGKNTQGTQEGVVSGWIAFQRCKEDEFVGRESRVCRVKVSQT